MASAKNAFSVRDWFGLAVGVSWGLVLGRFFASGDMTGPWLVILFGPPVVLLIAPERPILGWQLPIVTAALSGTIMGRSPDETTGMVLLDAVLLWLVCSFFSSPWALVFYYRTRRSAGPGAVKGPLAAYFGVAVLAFLVCVVTVLGFALTLYPADFSDARERATPFYGLFMVTGAIVVSVVAEVASRKLEIQKPVRAIFELVMVMGAVVGITNIVFAFLDTKSAGGLFDPTSPDGGLCSMLAGLEALAAVVWMTMAERRERKAVPEAPHGSA